MICRKCQHENPAEANFCLQCGAALGKSCPSCGKELPADAAFCMSCGHNLSQCAASPDPSAQFSPPAPSTDPDAAAPAGERRQATVLFSDLSGYTAMNEKLDPEEVEGVMRRIKSGAVEIVEEHGGIVNQFVGDEVLGLFGIPTAHKDDPRRAVKAALELHKLARSISPEVEDKIGRTLRMHTGINSGLIVTNLRDARDGTYGITGDTVNTGARLKALAEDDQILLSPDTQRLVSAYFETEALDAVELKGKGQPIKPFRVESELRGYHEGRQAFVGRQPELRQIDGMVDACLESGRGQAAYVRGEAGIGKTRIVEECRALAESRGFACHMGLTLDFGIGKGRDAIRAVVRSLLGIAPGSGKEIRRAAAERAFAEGVLSSGREPYLTDLLDYRQPDEWRGIYDAMDNDTRNRGKRETVEELVKAVSAQAPLLLVVEDLHWADAIGLAHLASLTAMVSEAPVVLLMTSRIEGDPLDAAWRSSTGGSPLLTMDLAPLRESEALQMAGEFMDATSRFAANCIERAEGNPLFLEQLLRSAEETEQDAVPGSVQSIVLARMDRLEPHDKQALQAASILGQHFGLDALRHLTGDAGYACTGLIAHYLVRPEGGDFLFCHALIQEVVYNSLLMARRRELHAQAAQWFAERDPVLRAVHLDRAENSAAPQAYLEAAQAQAAEFHYERAVQLAGRGLELATEQPEQFALTFLQGEMLHDLGSIPESIQAYEKALGAAQDDAQRCRAWIGIAADMRMSDRSDEALEALEKAQSLAEQTGLILELGQIHHLRGNLCFLLGRIDECMQEHERALELAHDSGSPEGEARALGGLGDAHYVRGGMRTANEYFGKCLELCKEHEFRRVEVAYACMYALTLKYLNDIRGAVENGRAAIESARQAGNLRAEIVSLSASMYPLYENLETGELALARERVGDLLALSRNVKAVRFEAGGLRHLASIEFFQRHRSKALGLINQALELAREGNAMRFIGPEILGFLALINGDAVARQSALAEGEELLRQGSVGHSYFRFYRQAMDVCLNTGEWAEVERYASALEDYTRPEPLPYSDFYIARGRALAAHGRGEREEALRTKLLDLKDEAERVGLKTALQAVEEALASF